MTRSFLGSEAPLGSLANSLLSAAGAFLLLLAINLAKPRSMGGGDVKYAFVIGLLLGYPGIITAGIVTAVTGGAWAIYLLAVRRSTPDTPAPLRSLHVSRRHPRASMGRLAVRRILGPATRRLKGLPQSIQSQLCGPTKWNSLI